MQLTLAAEALALRGPIGSGKWAEMLLAQWSKALAANGWREAHYGHGLMRLHRRGVAFGVRTFNGCARVVRDGCSEPAGTGALARSGRFTAIDRGGSSITITGPWRVRRRHAPNRLPRTIFAAVRRTERRRRRRSATP